jgi:ubiquinone/menaquinone biosynthesis C-methylase UbiE
MALNPSGRFSREGYFGQAKLVDAVIRRYRPGRVLELACGKGFNLGFLTEHHTEVTFTGIDLTPTHVFTARKLLRYTANAEVRQGDFHDLPFTDHTFQLVFVIESLCYAQDLDRALGEACRVLTPGGVLVVVDGWRKQHESKLSPLAMQAAQIVEGAMAVGGSRSLDEWLEAAKQGGFRAERMLDLSEQIMPNLLRFERMARRYVSWTPLRWLLRTLLPAKLIDNVAALYLMPVTVRGGIHTYNCVTLRLE